MTSDDTGTRLAAAAALVIATTVFGVGVPLWQSGLAEAQGAKAESARRSVWDGVYTEAQAKRGENTYTRSCESCHGADLSGNPVDEVPSLVWDAFLTQWNDRTLKDLFESVKRSMPRDNPGSLNARAYADVIAYVLQANKIPSGAKELSLNTDVLGQIVIDRKKQ